MDNVGRMGFQADVVHQVQMLKSKNFAVHIRIYYKHSVFQVLLVTPGQNGLPGNRGVLMDTVGTQELWGFQASSYTPINLNLVSNTMMLQMSVISHVQMCSSCRSKRPQRFTWCLWGDWDSWCPRTKWPKGIKGDPSPPGPGPRGSPGGKVYISIIQFIGGKSDTITLFQTLWVALLTSYVLSHSLAVFFLFQQGEPGFPGCRGEKWWQGYIWDGRVPWFIRGSWWKRRTWSTRSSRYLI